MNKKENFDKNLIKVLNNFSNIVFAIGICFFFFLSIYCFYRIFNPIYIANLGNKGVEQFYIFILLISIFFSGFFLFGLLRFNKNLKINLSLIVFSIGFSIYSIELYLEFSKPKPIELIAKEMGVEYDTRSYLQVLNDLNDSGIEAFPNIHPRTLHDFKNTYGKIHVLGSISNTTVIFNNESGYFPIIQTDEHGFNNSKGLYKPDLVDIVLIGDSFAEGISVKSDESISAVLRNFDYKTISLGKINNGPLSEFATLIEYAKPIRPRIVLWMYFVNDLSDLRMEIPSSLLTKYIDDDKYSQNLINRQDEIDNLLKNYIKVKLENKDNKESKNVKLLNTFKNYSINIIKLSKLRRIINLTPKSTPSPLFKKILDKANQTVNQWNGKMYFIYLPHDRYKTGKAHENRDFVIKTVNDLGIPIIDVHKEVFDMHKDPLSLFPFRFRNGGHYNKEGYRLVANAIKKRLEDDNYNALNSK